jgi:hypothetical protein
VTSKAEATPEPLAADRACAAHLVGGEADQGGCIDQESERLNGGLRGGLQGHVVRVHHHADFREHIPQPFQGALQGKGKELGAKGIPMAHPTLRCERGRTSGCAPDDQGPVELIRPRGKEEEARRLGGPRLQQGLPGHAVERIPEVQLQGHISGAARQAQSLADALATPKVADPKLQAAQHGLQALTQR